VGEDEREDQEGGRPRSRPRPAGGGGGLGAGGSGADSIDGKLHDTGENSQQLGFLKLEQEKSKTEATTRIMNISASAFIFFFTGIFPGTRRDDFPMSDL
jgi:hypothetical protein